MKRIILTLAAIALTVRIYRLWAQSSRYYVRGCRWPVTVDGPDAAARFLEELDNE